MTDVHRPLLGEPNAPCRSCGSPLAEDQRYCLQCGTRRAEARLPFLDILARQVGAPVVAETTTVQRPRGPAWLADLSPSTTMVAGVACLLLALGIGVLIGGWGNDGSATAGAVPNITVGGAAPAAAVTPASSAAPASTAAPEAAAAAGGAAKATKKKQAKAAASSSAGSKATNSAVKSLDSSSGSDYSKKSSKLPKTLGTGGKAPPVDKSGTKIGGGSDVESIG
jgi:hypothetical protein